MNIIAVVKFNDREAFVLDEKIKLTYMKFNNDALIGTDEIFYNFYYHEYPSKSFQAFGGRKFDITLDDGSVEHCNRQRRDGLIKNTMQGLTVEMPSNAIMWENVKSIAVFPRPFLSIEPIAGGLYKELPNKIELVIIGAETGNRKDKIIPHRLWLQSIIDHVPASKIHWKPNIIPYLKEYRLDTK